MKLLELVDDFIEGQGGVLFAPVAFRHKTIYSLLTAMWSVTSFGGKAQHGWTPAFHPQTVSKASDTKNVPAY